MKTFSQFKGG